MPVEFLTDEQVAAYGYFVGEPSPSEVERFFYLDDADRNLVARPRSDHHRLGFAVQLGTVRALGRFLEDPLDVPWAAVEFLAGQLDIGDASCVKQYVHRSKTPYQHAWEIRDRYGYRSFDDQGCAEAFTRFLHGRAWTHAEGPVALFEHAVAWLRRNRVLLPGVTVLARQVAAAREATETRLYEALGGSARRVDPRLPQQLGDLLQVRDGSRVSALERLRQSPRRSSGPEMVKALQRADLLAELGVGRVEVTDIPANRLQVLARTGLGSKASALARLGEPKRTATLVAVVRHLEAVAVDDTLDLFALLMATRLFSPVRCASAEQRLAMLPRLETASKTVARASRALLAVLTAAEGSTDRLDVAALWAAVETVVPRTPLIEAIGLVEELVPDDDGSAESAMRAALVGRYNTVRPFLNLLGDSTALHAAPGGEQVLAAVRSLPELARRRVGQKPLGAEEIDAELVTPAWRRAVYGGPDLPSGAVDRDAYVVCVLEQLHRALGRRDVFARPSHRWADPRALLLAGQRWEAVREDVLAGLSLTDPAPAHLARRLITLDAAWKQTAARLAEAGEDARARVVAAPNGRARLQIDHLDAIDEPDSLAWLRATAQAMLPRVDLPELLLEVHAWTRFLDAYTHLAVSTRTKDLPVSVAALLVAEACNVGLTPVIKPVDPALSRARLAHVDQYYVRAENHAAANAVLIDAQAQIPIAQAWGGGLLASVLHILDTLLNLDAGPRPEVVTTDNASYSDMVFGVFAILNYRFSPRFADLPDQRYWRAPLPDPLPSGVEVRAEQAAIGSYGPLEAIARNTINVAKISTQWPDMLRVAGSLVTNQVRAYDLLRMFGRDGHPTPLGQAFVEYGRIAKTLHLLAVVDPVDDTYQRRMNRQLTVQESRHRLGRKICHGNRGQIRQAYREGQEDQLAALGLVLNAVVLWNTRYLNAIVDDLRAKDFPVRDEDLARLSPLGHAHLNCLGRYAFTTRAVDGLRPLRDPAARDDTDGDW
jgi:TnpA family transposase